MIWSTSAKIKEINQDITGYSPSKEYKFIKKYLKPIKTNPIHTAIQRISVHKKILTDVSPKLKINLWK